MADRPTYLPNLDVKLPWARDENAAFITPDDSATGIGFVPDTTALAELVNYLGYTQTATANSLIRSACQPWKDDIDYVTSNVVNYSGSLWEATQDNINQEPGVSSAWISISSDGSLFLEKSKNLSDVVDSLTSFNNIKQQATTNLTGVAEIATQNEVDTGTDNTKIITPLTLAGANVVTDDNFYAPVATLGMTRSITYDASGNKTDIVVPKNCLNMTFNLVISQTQYPDLHSAIAPPGSTADITLLGSGNRYAKAYNTPSQLNTQGSNTTINAIGSFNLNVVDANAGFSGVFANSSKSGNGGQGSQKSFSNIDFKLSNGGVPTAGEINPNYYYVGTYIVAIPPTQVRNISHKETETKYIYNKDTFLYENKVEEETIVMKDGTRKTAKLKYSTNKVPNLNLLTANGHDNLKFNIQSQQWEYVNNSLRNRRNQYLYAKEVRDEWNNTEYHLEQFLKRHNLTDKLAVFEKTIEFTRNEVKQKVEGILSNAKDLEFTLVNSTKITSSVNILTSHNVKADISLIFEIMEELALAERLGLSNIDIKGVNVTLSQANDILKNSVDLRTQINSLISQINQAIDQYTNVSDLENALVEL